jgi:hypothetical protein
MGAWFRELAVGLAIGLTLDVVLLAAYAYGRQMPLVNLKPKTKVRALTAWHTHRQRRADGRTALQEERALVPYYDTTPWPYPKDTEAVHRFLENRQVQTSADTFRGAKKPTPRCTDCAHCAHARSLARR